MRNNTSDIVTAILAKGRKRINIREPRTLTLEARYDWDGFIDFTQVTVAVDQIKAAKNAFGEYALLKVHGCTPLWEGCWYNITSINDEDRDYLLGIVAEARRGK